MKEAVAISATLTDEITDCRRLPCYKDKSMEYLTTFLQRYKWHMLSWWTEEQQVTRHNSNQFCLLNYQKIHIPNAILPHFRWCLFNLRTLQSKTHGGQKGVMLFRKKVYSKAIYLRFPPVLNTNSSSQTKADIDVLTKAIFAQPPHACKT